jgi:hypothetical protein
VDDELDERAGQLVLFPRLGLVASLQPDNRVADVNRIARSHPKVAGQAVALVEDADRRHAFGHRRGGADFCGRCFRRNLRYSRCSNAEVVGSYRCLAGIAPDRILDRRRSRCQPHDRNYPANDPAIHAASGLHAS